MTTATHPELEGLGRYEFGWADSDAAGATARRGLNEDVVRDISAKKNEPEWMLKTRLKALRLFRQKPMPTWGSDLSGIDFDNIKYFVRSTEKQAASLGGPAGRHQEHLRPARHPGGGEAAAGAGVAAQYESEVVYHQINEELEAQGVIFVDTDTGLREYPELFQEYFAQRDPGGGQQVRRR